MFKKVIIKLSTQLNSHKIPYMIIGGQAVLLYGEPRFTRDIDITVGVDIDRLFDILKIIKKLKFRVLVGDIDNFVRETMVLPVVGFFRRFNNS